MVFTYITVLTRSPILPVLNLTLLLVLPFSSQLRTHGALGGVFSGGRRFLSVGNIVKSLRTAGQVWLGPQKKCGTMTCFLSPLSPSLLPLGLV